MFINTYLLKVFAYAFSSKQEGLKEGSISHMLWDKIFADVRAKVGGNVRLMLTGMYCKLQCENKF
jgi:hypothetical protein